MHVDTRSYTNNNLDDWCAGLKASQYRDHVRKDWQRSPYATCAATVSLYGMLCCYALETLSLLLISSLPLDSVVSSRNNNNGTR